MMVHKIIRGSNTLSNVRRKANNGKIYIILDMGLQCKPLGLLPLGFGQWPHRTDMDIPFDKYHQPMVDIVVQ
jgi:hypothetical protein